LQNDSTRWQHVEPRLRPFVFFDDVTVISMPRISLLVKTTQNITCG